MLTGDILYEWGGGGVLLFTGEWVEGDVSEKVDGLLIVTNDGGTSYEYEVPFESMLATRREVSS